MAKAERAKDAIETGVGTDGGQLQDSEGNAGMDGIEANGAAHGIGSEAGRGPRQRP